jgi:hypothetical protein
MALFTPALDNMFRETRPKRRGTKESVLIIHSATKRGATTLAGDKSLVRNNRGHDLVGRQSRFASSKIDKLAGRWNGVRVPTGWN